MVAKKKVYDEDSIKVLKYPINIQTRPTMYIGALGVEGNTHLAKETIDNSVDEAMNGYGKIIKIEISNKDGYCKVEDEGRGIPHNAIEKAFTNLHSSGKFDTDNYSVSAGTNGVGSTAVNALSKSFKVLTVNEGIPYIQTFTDGIADSPVKKSKTKFTKKSGTTVVFYPNEKFMGETTFDIETIKKELEMKSYINKGLKFEFVDKDKGQKSTYYHKNGIVDFITESGKLLYDPSHFVQDTTVKVKNKEWKVNVEIAMSYSVKNDFGTVVRGFTNSLYNVSDGTHVTGFKIGITSNIKKYIDSNNILTKKDAKLEITGDNIQDGLIAVVSVKYANAMYSSQTKEKLTSSEIQGVVLKVVNDELPKWMESHSKEMKLLCAKIILSAKASAAAKRAKETVSKKGETTLSVVSDLSKLAPCIEKDPNKIELFICEGTSAAGTAKECRDKYTQAIYSLRGKILNTNNLNSIKILDNKELSDITYILTGKRNGLDSNFDINSLKYKKICIMCDADSDGANIASLLITFFYQHMRPLVENGNLYVCLPPLYSIIQNGKKRYFLDQKEYDKYIVEKIEKDFSFMHGNGIRIQTKKELLSLINKLNKYSERLNNLESSIGLNKYFIDEIVNIKESNIKMTNKTLLSNIRELGDIKIKKIDNSDADIFGLFNSNYIKTTFKTIIKYMNELLSYRNELKLPKFMVVSLYNEMDRDLDAKTYDKIITEVTPKSRMRFKGLGEMDAHELWETTMNPATRNVLQVMVSDVDKTDEIQENLFNQNPKYADKRKIFLIKNQERINNELLDI